MALRGASARRYAEAVFELAVEQNTLDDWSRDLQTIADFAGEADVARLLGSNRMPAEEKLRLLSAGLERVVSPLAWNFVRVLAARGKLAIVRQVQLAYQQTADDRRGIAHATVTTAVPLGDDEKTAVAARLSAITGKQVDVTAIVDDSIIGGMVARIGDRLIDASTRTKLVALKRRIARAGA